MRVAGLDPGRNTTVVVVDDAGVIAHLEHIELDGDMIKRGVRSTYYIRIQDRIAKTGEKLQTETRQ